MNVGKKLDEIQKVAQSKQMQTQKKKIGLEKLWLVRNEKVNFDISQDHKNIEKVIGILLA